MRGFLIAAGLVVAAAVVGIAVNLALLGFARPNDDPVGRLSPRGLTVPTVRSAPPPATSTAPSRTDTGDHRSDDD